MRTLSIALNEMGEYTIEEVVNERLVTYASKERNHDAVLAAKWEIEKNPLKGDRVINTYGIIYTWTGNGWRAVKPSMN